MAMNHDKLRKILLRHVDDDREAHAKLLDAVHEHAEEDTEQDHSDLIESIQEHASLVETDHQSLMALLDMHIAEA